MATLLDVGVLGHFAPVFTFLFVFVLIYAVLSKVDPWGSSNKGIYSIIAVCMAALTLFFAPVVQIINIMAPWFVLLMVFAFFVILVMMAFGTKADTITNVLKNNDLLIWTIIGIGIAIAIFAFSQVYGSSLASDSVNQTGNQFNNTVKDILFHPKMLGVIFMLLIATFAVRLLSSDAGK